MNVRDGLYWSSRTLVRHHTDPYVDPVGWEAYVKLIISRSQADVKGFLGGHKGVSFTLAYRLELTPDEMELVRRYQLESYPLTWTDQQGIRTPDDTVGALLAGRSQTLNDVTTLVRNEEIVKDACDSLPVLFDVVRSFGGDEVVQYPRT